MNKIIIELIKIYQKFHTGGISHCRYFPTCSNYGIEAFKKFNFFYATFITIFRILRCNKLFKGGYEPVPPNWFEKLYKEDYRY